MSDPTSEIDTAADQQRDESSTIDPLAMKAAECLYLMVDDLTDGRLGLLAEAHPGVDYGDRIARVVQESIPIAEVRKVLKEVQEKLEHIYDVGADVTYSTGYEIDIVEDLLAKLEPKG